MGLISKAAEAKSDQLNAADLIGTELIIKIVRVDVELAKDQKVTVHAEHIDGKNIRAFRPCKNMQRVMMQGWGADESTYGGKYLRLFHDPKVKWAGEEVGGVRVNGMSNIKHDFKFNYRSSRTVVTPMMISKLDMSSAKTTDQPEVATQETMEAGAEAAGKGVAAYTEWKDSLAPEVKATIKPYHNQWAAKAKAFDVEQKNDGMEEIAI